MRFSTLARLVGVSGLLLGWAFHPAHAFSRVVIVTSEPLTIAMDGMPQPGAIGNRTTMHAVPPGTHTFALFTSSGQLMHEEAVSVPDNADVHIQWSRGTSFVITGAASAGAGAAGTGGGGGGVNYANDSPTGVSQSSGSWTNSTGGTTSTGTLGPASGPRPSDYVVGGGRTGAAGAQGRAVQSVTGSNNAKSSIS